MSNQVQDAAQLFARAVKCWQQSDAFFKRSGELLTEAEKLRKDSVAMNIETSRWLCEAFDKASAERPYGGWGRLFTNPSLPPGFSKSNADRLRPIWGNDTFKAALTDSAILRKLPSTRFTLATLAQVAPDRLQTYIEEGDVHPKMTESDADKLLRNGPSASRELNPLEVVRRALKSVRRQLAT